MDKSTRRTRPEGRIKMGQRNGLGAVWMLTILIVSSGIGSVTGDTNTDMDSQQSLNSPMTRAENIPQPYIEVEMSDHRPMLELEMQCLYYPLRATGRKSFYIHNVTFLEFRAQKIQIKTTYESLEGENITANLMILWAVERNLPDKEYCNQLWRTMTPKFLVYRDLQAYENTQPIILKTTTKKTPYTCLYPTTAHHILHNMGQTSDCPRNRIFMDVTAPWPATDYMIWVCGEYVYTYLPTYWTGNCAPYWIPAKTTYGRLPIPNARPTELPEETVVNFQENDDEILYQNIGKPTTEGHPFQANLWYNTIENKVRRMTQNSCYACSLLPRSTEEIFPYWAIPLIGPEGLPTFCVIAYQHMLQTHPLMGAGATTTIKPIIMPNSIYMARTSNMVSKERGRFYKMSQYVIYSNISIRQENGRDVHINQATIFSIPEQLPAVAQCPAFFRKHILNVPSDLAIIPARVSANINTSAIFDVCIEGQARKSRGTITVGSLKRSQCILIFENIGESKFDKGMLPIPGFFWCCGTAIWNSLPANFSGLCGVCTMNDPIYIVQPIEFVHSIKHRNKRHDDTSDPFQAHGYVHLQNTDPQALSEKYYELPEDFQIFSHTQLVFKSLFWNTELSYQNHYLIALTRHELFRLANTTLMGFQALGSEIALIRQFAMDNRVALDAITASQGGVCAIVGGDTCCTYLPSKSEGIGNLTRAIKNLRHIQNSVVRTNKETRDMGGYNSDIFRNMVSFFSGHPIVAWLISVGGTFLILVILIVVVMACCFPIARHLIAKSIRTITAMPLITTGDVAIQIKTVKENRSSLYSSFGSSMSSVSESSAQL